MSDSSKFVSPIKPFEVRDFSRGRISRSSTNTYLAPANSVANSMNVNFDTIIGSVVVRSGTALIGGAAVSAGMTPLGLAYFANPQTSINMILAGFTGASTGAIWSFSSATNAWSQSSITLSNTAKMRFAQLGGQMFMANGVNGFQSTTDGINWTSTNTVFVGDSVVPSLVFRTTNLMLAGGWSTYPDRVYFSSPCDVTSSPFITWNSNSSTGDWVDVNPDDGGVVTGFAEASAQVLIFKSNGMYRLDTPDTPQLDADQIVNIGAPSQEAITNCQGVVYFYSGIDIRATTGSYPEQISRTGVQDYLDAIPQSYKTSVTSGNDGLNVYFSIGTVTVGTGDDKQMTYVNTVLKYSTRDQSWSIHYYAQLPVYFSQFINPTRGNPLKAIFSDTTGSVQTLNMGVTDGQTTETSGNGGSINYFLESQDIDLDNRAHTDALSNTLVVFTNHGIDSKIQIRDVDGDYTDVQQQLNLRVNIASDIEFEGNSLIFRWYGESSATPPVFEGIYIENVSDLGLVDNSN